MNSPKLLASRLNGTLVIVFTTFVLGSIVKPGAAQSCAGLPAPPATTQEALVASDAWDSALGIEQCGRIMVVTHQLGEVGLDETVRVMIQRFLPDATVSGATQRLSAPHEGLPPCGPIHEAASIAVSPLGRVRVDWRGLERDCQEGIGYVLLEREFEFGQSPEPVGVQGDPDGPQQHTPSTCISDLIVGIDKLGGVAWAQTDGTTTGLLAATDVEAQHSVRGCTPYCREEFWHPAACMAPDGTMALVWAEAETDQAFSWYNIALRLYDPQGNIVDEYDGRVRPVNNPALESQFSSQMEPSVAFDGRNLVVVWVGYRLDSCLQMPARIFGRRLIYEQSTGLVRDPSPAAGEGVEGMFVVDTDPSAIHDVYPIDLETANPAVALAASTEPDLRGAFVVAWDSRIAGDVVPNGEVRARYFAPDGMPRGNDFRVNVATSPTGTPDQRIRQLANSAAHTLAYGRQGQVAVTWGAYGDFPDILVPWELVAGRALPPQRLAWLTLLPPGQGDMLCAERDCLRGDCNRDGLIDGRDIQSFVAGLIFGFAPEPPCYAIPDICEYDCNEDCRLTVADIPPFICKLLGLWPTCTGGYSSPPPTMPDCNTNGIDDAADIAALTSVDCNTDGIPDECQLTFYDCNSNSVLDSCDVDPGDPDGNESVSPDCNSNGWPDECDFGWTYMPSYDCNTNGIPDECDIAEATSEDCNTNGVPDECDIAAETSEDVDTNGIPDECEAQQMMQGGGGGGSDGSPYDNPAWEEFWQWQSDNAASLATMSPWSRFKATVDKLRELGLPAAIPRARVGEASP